MGTLCAVPQQAPPLRSPVLTVSSNKGGVGKTTVATNLAVYLRALLEDLPVLVVGLDDQNVIDRMFALRPGRPDDGNLKHGWAERSLTRLIQLGEYGIHFVPSPPDTALLKARASDPLSLARILDRTEWEGLVILDTKSDLEALTLNALHAADRIVLPVADRTSLEEAGKIFTLLERAGMGGRLGRVLLTLVDLRTRVDDQGHDVMALLIEEIRRRGWPLYESFLSRSPRVEALNSGTGKPLSILHHAKGTLIHRQMRAFAEEVIAELRLDAFVARLRGGTPAPEPVRVAPGGDDWKAMLFRGLRGR
jgi:cellulose biosynthesis protein BcsQ